MYFERPGNEGGLYLNGDPLLSKEIQVVRQIEKGGIASRIKERTSEAGQAAGPDHLFSRAVEPTTGSRHITTLHGFLVKNRDISHGGGTPFLDLPMQSSRLYNDLVFPRCCLDPGMCPAFHREYPLAIGTVPVGVGIWKGDTDEMHAL